MKRGAFVVLMATTLVTAQALAQETEEAHEICHSRHRVIPSPARPSQIFEKDFEDVCNAAEKAWNESASAREEARKSAQRQSDLNKLKSFSPK